MASIGQREIGAVRAVLARIGPALEERAREVHALLRTGAGEEDLVARLRALSDRPARDLVEPARELLRIGIRPTGGYRRRKIQHDVCTICEKEVTFCWGCRCGFRICQACLEENRWGITCNNITWECPDCGGMRSF